jgi:hypothetical protein
MCHNIHHLQYLFFLCDFGKPKPTIDSNDIPHQSSQSKDKDKDSKMFRKIFRRKKGQLKVAEAPLEEARPEPAKIKEKVEEVKKVAAEKVEEAAAKAEELKEAIEEAMQDGKCKMWFMDSICCCMKGEEAAKAGALTDVADV